MSIFTDCVNEKKSEESLVNQSKNTYYKANIFATHKKSVLYWCIRFLLVVKFTFFLIRDYLLKSFPNDILKILQNPQFSQSIKNILILM